MSRLQAFPRLPTTLGVSVSSIEAILWQTILIGVSFVGAPRNYLKKQCQHIRRRKRATNADIMSFLALMVRAYQLPSSDTNVQLLRDVEYRLQQTTARDLATFLVDPWA